MIVCQMVARRLSSFGQSHSIGIVPVPNSGATANNRSFRTMELAQKIAALAPGKLRALPALRWRRPLVPAHRGGPRNPNALLENLALIRKPDSPVVLFDDVMTSGGHMVACYRRLSGVTGAPIARRSGPVFGTKARVSEAGW